MKQFLIPSLAFLLLSCSTTPRQGRVTILHTNDMHAQFTSLPATWVKDDVKPQIGGMVALEYFVRRARDRYSNSLLLDGGDFCTGTLISKIEVNGARNGGFVEMMNMIGYDAIAIGNHELDEGQENLRDLIAFADFDMLAANLIVDGKQLAPKAYTIYEVGGVRVGVIGIILSHLFEVTAVNKLHNVHVSDPAETAQRLIDEIDPKTDLIILLTHQGVDNDIELARRLQNVDIIVGGHSHTRLRQPLKENGVIIVQAGSKTRTLGRLTVDVAGDSVSNYEGELTATWVDSVKAPHPALQALVTQYQRQIMAEYGRQIGVLKTAWTKSNAVETNLGDFITDIMRRSTNADFALLNSGGIRKGLQAGPITKMDIWEIFPFSNYVGVFECSGRRLRDILEFSLQRSINEGGGIPQVSGIEHRYRVVGDSVRTISLKIGDRRVQPDSLYRGATVDFVISQLSGFDIKNINMTPLLLPELIIDYIIEHPNVDVRVQQRIRRDP